MREVWMMWQEITKTMCEDEEECKYMMRDQNYLARRMITILPDRLDLIAELSGLTSEEVKKEKDRLDAAWEHVLYGGSSEDAVIDTHITYREVVVLQAIRAERRRCVFGALDRGLTPDVIRDVLDIGEKEMNFWRISWKEREKKPIL